jgi:hypothetical protein
MIGCEFDPEFRTYIPSILGMSTKRTSMLKFSAAS